MSNLKLEIQGKPVLGAPTRQSVLAVLAQLNPEAPNFIILSRDDGSYVQTAGTSLRLTVEYRQAVSDGFQHFTVGRNPPDPCPTSIAGISWNVHTSECLSLGDAQFIFTEFLDCGRIPPSYALRNRTSEYQANTPDSAEYPKTSPRVASFDCSSSYWPFDPSKGYRLIIQFRGSRYEDYHAMAALEERMSEDLGQSAKMGTFEIGRGGATIFINSSDPAATFARVRKSLQREGLLQAVTAAYHELTSQEYIVLWPEDSNERFVVG